MTRTYTTREIRNLFDLLSAKVRANLLTGEKFRAERAKLYELAHTSMRSESIVGCSADCPFCADGRSEPILQHMGSGKPPEEIKGLRKGIRI